MSINITGLRELQRNLERHREQVIREVEQSLVESALIVERDAKIKAPFDFGRLRNSISHETDFGSSSPRVTVGTNIEYAKYQEFGTSRIPAHPYLFPALRENESRIRRKIIDGIRRGMGL